MTLGPHFHPFPANLECWAGVLALAVNQRYRSLSCPVTDNLAPQSRHLSKDSHFDPDVFFFLLAGRLQKEKDGAN